MGRVVTFLLVEVREWRSLVSPRGSDGQVIVTSHSIESQLPDLSRHLYMESLELFRYSVAIKAKATT